MLAEERYHRILELLRKGGAVKVGPQAGLCAGSVVTIARGVG